MAQFPREWATRMKAALPFWIAATIWQYLRSRSPGRPCDAECACAGPWRLGHKNLFKTLQYWDKNMWFGIGCRGEIANKQNILISVRDTGSRDIYPYIYYFEFICIIFEFSWILMRFPNFFIIFILFIKTIFKLGSFFALSRAPAHRKACSYFVHARVDL